MKILKTGFGYHHHRCPTCITDKKEQKILEYVIDKNGQNLDRLKYCSICQNLFEVNIVKKKDDKK